MAIRIARRARISHGNSSRRHGLTRRPARRLAAGRRVRATPRSATRSSAARGHRTGTTTTSCCGRAAGPARTGRRGALPGRPRHGDRDRPRAGARVRAARSGFSGAVVRFEQRGAAGRAGVARRRPRRADRRGAALGRGGARGDDRHARRPRLARPADPRSGAISSATCSRRCCCGSSAGTTPRTPSAPTRRGALPALRHAARARVRPPPRRRVVRGRARRARRGALTRASRDVTGRTTKQLVTDRVLLEAARLLRFTDLTVGEIAFRTGYEDQLYFSRAFKRRYGDAPTPYRNVHRHPSNV